MTVHTLPAKPDRVLADAEMVALLNLDEKADILYAKAKRYTLAYEADSDGAGIAAGDLRDAAEVFGEAHDDYLTAADANGFICDDCRDSDPA